MTTPLQLPGITDEFMLQSRANLHAYAIVLLRHGPAYDPPTTDSIIWEHGRRNFALRAAGLLAIVCPIRDGTEWAGIGIFNASAEQTEEIMRGDPAVQADVLAFEVHACASFPGDALPA